jgi:hypothetical protein
LLPRMKVVQSVKEFATYSARFEIRLVYRHSDQSRPRSSALRLGGHTLRLLFCRLTTCLFNFVVPVALRVSQISCLSIVACLSGSL